MFNKDQRINYDLAYENAKGCDFMFRHGDIDTDHRMHEGGVRIIVQNFGNFQPFVLRSTTKDWLKKNYSLKDNQANDIYKLLLARAKKDMRFLEDQAKAELKTRPKYQDNNISRAWASVIG